MSKRTSSVFCNDDNWQKVVDDERIVGYTVSPESHNGSARVRPLYEAVVYFKSKVDGKTQTTILHSHEAGEALNGQYFEDAEGARLAAIACHAIAALEERAQARRAAEEAKKNKKRTKRP